MSDNALVNTVVSIAKAYPVVHVSIFGSRARGDYTDSSDLDLLVKFDSSFTSSQYFDLWDEIERELGLTVDILSPDALPQLPSAVVSKITSEARCIYEV
jgi:predicted nucleotidyltransferase